MADVRAHADRIMPGFVHFIRDNRLDLVFVHDLLSVGCNLTGMLALVEAIRETGVRTVVELAIDLIAELNRPEGRHRLEAAPMYDGRRFGPEDRIVLVCAGYVEGILEEVLAEAGLRLKADA